MKPIRFTLLSFCILFLSACGTNGIFKSGNKSEKQVVNYTSTGNDIAAINLEFKPGGKFHLTYSDAETGDSKTYKGKWDLIESRYQLKFKGNPDLKGIFPPEMSPASNVKFIDDDMVRFPENKKELWIWGIYCTRE